MNLKGNTILITGGAGGIGFELAKQLTQLGNTVIITGRNTAKLEKAKKALPNLHTIQSDVTDTAEIKALFEKVTKQFPDLNILINNAGIMLSVNLHDKSSDLKDLTKEIDTNLHGPIRMTKQFLNHLKSKPNAAIVNVSSGLAFTPLPASPIYCATKAGLHSFTLSLRVQMKNSNVQIFELAPPATQTELLGDFPAEDMKGISIMKVEDMVSAALRGLKNDQLEICPGQSTQLRLMSRLAPKFILKQMSKPVERMLQQQKN